MKVLYVAPLWEGSTALDRERALEAAGVTLVPLDTTPYIERGWRVIRSLAGRLNWGPPVWRLNRDLLAAARREARLDVLWVEKGTWIHPETLLAVREETGALLVHSTVDPALVWHRSRHFEASIPVYDLLMTHKAYEVELYRSKGARRLLCTRITASARRFHPRALTSEERRLYGTDVTFIGHHEAHYARCLEAAARAAPRMAIWGSGWPRHAWRLPWARPLVRGSYVHGEAYPRALCGARVAIGLLTKYAPDTVTSRSLEIPFCGVFMLAERSPDHVEMFEEDREAAFFSTPEELEDKVRFWLAHDEARERVARAGRERCLRSGYSTEEAVPGMLSAIREAMEGRETT